MVVEHFTDLVVYFDKHLVDVHSKGWLRYAFSICFVKKDKKGKKKARNLMQNLAKKWGL